MWIRPFQTTLRHRMREKASHQSDSVPMGGIGRLLGVSCAWHVSRSKAVDTPGAIKCCFGAYSGQRSSYGRAGREKKSMQAACAFAAGRRVTRLNEPAGARLPLGSSSPEASYDKGFISWHTGMIVSLHSTKFSTAEVHFWRQVSNTSICRNLHIKQEESWIHDKISYLLGSSRIIIIIIVVVYAIHAWKDGKEFRTGLHATLESQGLRMNKLHSCMKNCQAVGKELTMQ
jgi:hypothetical protein